MLLFLLFFSSGFHINMSIVIFEKIPLFGKHSSIHIVTVIVITVYSLFSLTRMLNDIRSYFINNNAEEVARVDKASANSLPINDDSEYYMKDTTEYNQRNKHAFREFLNQHEIALRSKTIFKKWKKEKSMRVMQTTIGDYYQNKLKEELEYQRKTEGNRSSSTEKKESCHYHNSQLPSPSKKKRRVRFAKGTRAEKKTFRKRLRSPPRNLTLQRQSRQKCQLPQLASLKMTNAISSGKKLNDEMMTDEQLIREKER